MDDVADQQHRKVSHFSHFFSWQTMKRILTVLFFSAVTYILFIKARDIEWAKVAQTLKATETSTLLLSIALSLLCYSVYASYDLFGRASLNIPVSKQKTWLVAWISYACNLNLGALIGSVAFRYRLYSRLGVEPAQVTRIIGISVATNWLGYLLLSGILFVSGSVDVPKSWMIGDTGLQVLGAIFLLIIIIYLMLCLFSSRRDFSIRGHSFSVPSIQMAIIQFVTASIHWTLMALVMYQFFQGQVPFTQIYAVLLISCVAGAISHIPGGLGVLEAVFLALLNEMLPRHEILAAVFAYRCVFYFIPLLITLPIYLTFETRHRKAAILK